MRAPRSLQTLAARARPQHQSTVAMPAASSLMQQATSQQHRSLHTELQMKENKITLPSYQGAVHNYVKAQSDGDTLFIGDHVGQDESQTTVRGKVGPGEGDISPEQAYDLARNAGLRLLSTLSHYCDGNLDRVDQVVKVGFYFLRETIFIRSPCKNKYFTFLGRS